MPKLTIKKEPGPVWHSEYQIYLDGDYSGWIAKYREENKEWEVFSSSLRIGPLIGNNTFNTLKSAKDYVKYKVEYLMEVEEMF